MHFNMETYSSFLMYVYAYVCVFIDVVCFHILSIPLFTIFRKVYPDRLVKILDRLSGLQMHYHYLWCQHSITYLENNISPTYYEFYNTNYPLFQDIYRSLRQWNTYNLSVLGRIAALKMAILPKLLYYFETLLIPIPILQLRNLKGLSLNLYGIMCT